MKNALKTIYIWLTIKEKAYYIITLGQLNSNRDLVYHFDLGM